jgi:hypothetical protein
LQLGRRRRQQGPEQEQEQQEQEQQEHQQAVPIDSCLSQFRKRRYCQWPDPFVKSTRLVAQGLRQALVRMLFASRQAPAQVLAQQVAPQAQRGRCRSVARRCRGLV